MKIQFNILFEKILKEYNVVAKVMVQSQVPPESNCGGLDKLFNISRPQFLRVNNPLRVVALYPHAGIMHIDEFIIYK